ncbi:MAG: hypothetical protein ACE5KY_04785, partial [Candidatus Tectimicrobiota bacterium]
NHRDLLPATGQGVSFHDHGAGGFVPLGVGVRGGDFPEGRFVRPGHEDVLSLVEKSRRDVPYLGRGLAGAEDDLRKTSPQMTVVVELRETEIFERQEAELLGGVLCGDSAG